jgi:hypothetical protein
MIAGYYDRTGYADMYTGPTNGGVMPMDNSAWGYLAGECPLSATHNGIDGRTTNGHVDDYWISYGSTGPDPWEGNWAEHAYGDCTGDYMKTNQWVYPALEFNRDGSTIFVFNSYGAPAYSSDLENSGWDVYDGGYGLKLFYESRGYTVANMYNQYILGYASATQGFTYSQYKAEIDAGRPVMIHLENHTVVGIGYDDSSDLVYVHDTWDYNTHTMTWGDPYYGMDQMGVTIVQLGSVGTTITSCDISGNEKNSFAPDEEVYVKACGLEANTTYRIWIQDEPVVEGELLDVTEDPSGEQPLITTDDNGCFAATAIWTIPSYAPATAHLFDIVVDKQYDGGNTGYYNASSDGIDSATAVGFTAPVPDYPSILLLGTGFLGVIGVLYLRKKRKGLEVV